MRIDYELMKCSCREKLCPVYEKCCFLPTECHPDTKGNVSLLFVGQGGGSDERRLVRPFIGKAGKRIRQQIVYVRKKLGKHIGVAFSNTIRDNPDDNRIPTSLELKCCLRYLYQDISELKKRGLGVVILLGNAAKEVFMPKSGPMIETHGKLIDFTNDICGDIKVMPTYHPSYVIRNAPKFDANTPSEYDKPVIKDIIRAYEFCRDKKKNILDIESEVLDLF